MQVSLGFSAPVVPHGYCHCVGCWSGHPNQTKYVRTYVCMYAMPSLATCTHNMHTCTTHKGHMQHYIQAYITEDVL